MSWNDFLRLTHLLFYEWANRTKGISDIGIGKPSETSRQLNPNIPSKADEDVDEAIEYLNGTENYEDKTILNEINKKKRESFQKFLTTR